MMKRLMVSALICCSIIITPIECSKKRKSKGNSKSVTKHIDKSKSLEKKSDWKDLMLKKAEGFKDNHPDALTKILSFGAATAGLALSAFAGIGYENLAVPKHLVLLGLLGAHAVAGYKLGTLTSDQFKYPNGDMDLGVGVPMTHVLGSLLTVMVALPTPLSLENPIKNPALIYGLLAANHVFCWYKTFNVFNELQRVLSDPYAHSSHSHKAVLLDYEDM